MWLSLQMAQPAYLQAERWDASWVLSTEFLSVWSCCWVER